MKFLMLKQPWPNLIALKRKDLESRYWKKDCSYRGKILICASKKPMKPAEVRAIMTPAQWINFENLRTNLDYDIYCPNAVAICQVNMINFRPMNRIEDPQRAFVAYHPSLKILELTDIRPVVSFPVTGMLGLLNLPPEYANQIQFD